jgi:hypothetical protein
MEKTVSMTTRAIPYDTISQVPSFTVTITDVADGEELPTPHVSGIFGAGGSDTSPQLSWSGLPEETKSFAITVYRYYHRGARPVLDRRW